MFPTVCTICDICLEMFDGHEMGVWYVPIYEHVISTQENKNSRENGGSVRYVDICYGQEMGYVICSHTWYMMRNAYSEIQKRSRKWGVWHVISALKYLTVMKWGHLDLVLLIWYVIPTKEYITVTKWGIYCCSILIRPMPVPGMLIPFRPEM